MDSRLSTLTPLRAWVIVLLGASALAGCYAGKPTDAGQNGDGMPYGIVSSRDEAQRDGVYITSSDDDANCCWLARAATFRTHANVGATRVRLTVVFPDAGPYQKRPMDVTVSVDGARAKKFGGLRSGIRALDVPIPRGRERDVAVRVQASYTWTAAQQHINGDTRELSLQLKSVRSE